MNAKSTVVKTLTASGVVWQGPVWFVGIFIRATGDGDVVTVCEGSNSAEAIAKVNCLGVKDAVADCSPPEPLYFPNGLYVTLDETVTSVDVFYRAD